MTCIHNVPGYTLRSCLFDGAAIAVWRGVRDSDGLPVTLKIVDGAVARLQDVVRLRHEYEITKSLPVPGIVRPLDYREFEAGAVLVLEEVDGISLAQVMARRPFSIEQSLQIAAELAGTLAELHGHNVVHKDIKPANIIVESDGSSVRIADFGIASVVLRNEQDTASVLRPEGTLAYISPEQTGRMNWRVDWRSDLYSLGVSLFELFTGERPFEEQDELALVHAHIAKLPPFATEVAPAVPAMVAEIIAKLMSKSPDERYQNGLGLKKDLLRCLDAWRATGEVPRFPLGRDDISDKFKIPQKLYGREAELKALLAAFKLVRKGQARIVTIRGYSGVGKSALVHELQRPIARMNGHFITGKFEQFNLDIPYSSLIQAFGALIRQILAESCEEIARLKRAIEHALGGNAAIIVNVIPELAEIIGPQPPVADLMPAESLNRFTLLFQEFIQVFATRERPLCLFLDDLQWADQPSLKLIADVLADPQARYLLLLGAYRDNEVDSAHPLVKMLEKIARMGVQAEALVLEPLATNDIGTMIRETFKCAQGDAISLAEVCIDKTAGNPFFLAQFLRKLYEEGVIAFDASVAQWRWELQQIRDMEIADNVVAFMAERIRVLPERAKTTLKLAACIGNVFPLPVLATVSGRTPDETLEDLGGGIREGLVIPDGAGLAGAGPHAPATFRFLHDRVQQAAYSLYDEAERRETHLKVGKLMIANATPAQRERQLFDIVSHLNKGASLMSGRAERDELAGLNMEAGKKAKKSGAFEPAYRLFEAAGACLAEDAWARNYALALDCHLERSEAAYLCGKYAESHALSQAALAHARSLWDRVRVHEVMIFAYNNEGKNRESVDCARAILDELGFRYPARPQKRHLRFPIYKAKWLLRGKSDAALLSLPPLNAPDKLAVFKVFTRATIPAFLAAPFVAFLWIPTEIGITLREGRSPYTAYAYGSYAFMLCGLLGEYDEGKRFARLAERLIEQDPGQEGKGAVFSQLAIFVLHWRATPEELERHYWKGYEYALAEGELVYASFALYAVTHLMPWYNGEKLAAFRDKMDRHAGALKKLQQDRVNLWDIMERQTVANLMDPGIADPTVLRGAWVDEAGLVAAYDSSGDMVGKGKFYLNKLILCCLFREFGEAAAHVAETDKLAAGFMGRFVERTYHLYYSLTLLGMDDETGRTGRRETLKRAGHALRMLRRMESEACPTSRHPPRLLEAEIMRVEGKFNRAAELYDEAIHYARACGHHYEEALANELCGRFYRARGRDSLAEYYLARAYMAYRTWGGAAKLAQMRRAYPAIAFPAAVLAAPVGGAGEVMTEAQDVSTSLPSASSSSGSDASLFDLETVMKATRAISGEIVLARLLGELLKIVLENAGAQRGVLLLSEDQELFVEGELDSSRVEVLQRTPLNDFPRIARSVVNHARRTQASVVLDDAGNGDEYANDPYLLAGEVRSLLCMVILNKGDFMGLLYLENNAAPGAFTVERMEILKVICAQIAVSIENARLYESIELKVEERTRELKSANRKAEEAARSKSMFLANMSHEIRTPMNAIIGFSELALRLELSPVVRDYLTKILNSSEALLAVLNDILDYSKVEAGRMDIDPVEFRPEALMERVANLFSALASEKRLELVFEIGASVPPVLIGDPVRLGQVLNNLVGNAVKFTPSGEVHVRLSQVAAEPGYSTLSIEVRDTGIGMSAAQAASLFQPFMQADSSITRRFGGTGLGLAISNRLVALMGGEISVQSEEGEGSTFVFTLRLPVADMPHAAPLPAELGVSHVLVVDDVALSRRILAQTCRGWGLTAVEADSGPAALAALQSARAAGSAFDLVVLDWKMPGMDGLALARAIRDDAGKAGVKKPLVVIMTTPFSREQLVRESIDAVQDAILIKPVMPSALLESILAVQASCAAHDRAQPAPHLWKTAPAALADAHILLVEDHEINQFVACEFLGHAGALVTVASNGWEAVRAVKEAHFDAVLMDVHMPVLDGLEAARLIRQDGRFRDLPIIAMTGAVMSEDRAACYEAGMNDHLAKPLLHDDLIATLGKWIAATRDARTAAQAGTDG